jgi:hypothetical protein
MKEFCAKLLKTLALPLLREVESVSALRPDAEPFTPRRSARLGAPASAIVGRQPRKASAAETVLLKALGITPMDLTVDDAALEEFRKFFDSPVREQHLRVLASIFGKTLPSRSEMALLQRSVEVSVHA